MKEEKLMSDFRQKAEPRVEGKGTDWVSLSGGCPTLLGARPSGTLTVKVVVTRVGNTHHTYLQAWGDPQNVGGPHLLEFCPHPSTYSAIVPRSF